ncbi:uncharacterized protein BYT42DRAFT_558741 [Radiomyces spectabilis]|uniref:uncharacterized protein n=1 Tax=Radiomyces spectabilis TaxID=64574 RepID=UPI00221F0444|nr:uncharacterized protein BYT42DRAFT_558741 [Radiomyces spectabilis]KAI8388044.1 hypothetical protein BYT42DRAFT_558741 [Radiomyces spectabilis]
MDTEQRHGFFDLSVNNTAEHPRLSQLFSTPSRPNSIYENEDRTDTRRNEKEPGGHVTFPPKLEQRFNPPNPQGCDQGSDEDQNPDPLPTRTERLLEYLHEKFPSRVVRRVLKCTIAYFVSTLFSLFPQIVQALGPAPFLVTTGMLFSHPGRSMGAQFDATVTAVLGVVLAVLYAFAALAASTAYNVRHMDTYTDNPVGLTVNAIFLFCGIFGAQMLRQMLPKFHFFSLQFMIVQIFSLTRGVNLTSVPFHLPLDFGIPLMIGAGLSLVINLCIWPETAVDGLGRALNETFSSSRDMLDMITRQFFLDPQSDMMTPDKIDEVAAKLRTGMTKVKSAYREAKYEISIACIRPQDLGTIRKSLDRMTRHLNILGGCVKSERELFESALEFLAAEMSDMESEDDLRSVYTSGEEDQSSSHRRSGLPKVYSEEDLHLLKAALRATTDYTQTGKYTSPRSSRAPSRRNSIDDDDDESDHHQRSVTSFKSFLNLSKLSRPKPKPPRKSKKQIEYGTRHLLMTYLESLRDPLMQLSLECTEVMACVSYGILDELDMHDETNKTTHKSLAAYLRHLFKLGPKRAESINSQLALHRDHCNCAQTIRDAIREFDEQEKKRMQALYQSNQSRNNGALDLGMREELFLVFFFIFTLREVANELEIMTINMDELRSNSRKRGREGKRRRRLYMPQINVKWWKKWSAWNNHQSMRDKGGYAYASLIRAMPNDERTPDAHDEYRLAKIQTTGSLKRQVTRRGSKLARAPSHESSTIAPTTPIRRRAVNRMSRSSDATTSPTTPETINEKNVSFDPEAQDYEKQAEEKTPVFLHIRYNIWKYLQYVKRYEFKFAMKMAVAVSVLCLPAFVPSSMAWFRSVRGQWASMTVIAIMNPTSGGTLQASLWRILGTLIGAFMGWAALEAGGGGPYLLALFAVVLAIPFFYIHLASTYNKVGIVVLVTYMVVALSRYAVPVPGETIAQTVWKRTVTMIVGICVAMCLNWMVWPFIARHATRKSISGILSEFGDYYTFLMGTFLYHHPMSPPTEEDIKKATKIENRIQSLIDAASVLLELTNHEPRLKGPFPKDFYKEMIVALRNLLDRMLSIRTALTKMSPFVKRDICDQEYYLYRRDMIAAMLLHFHTLAASLRSKMPLPVYMPSARAARTRLITHRQEESDKEKWVRFRNLTWFAMACSTEEIIEELEYLTNLVKFIVGESRYADKAKRIDMIMSNGSTQ